MMASTMFPAVNSQQSGVLPNFCDVRIIFMLVLITELLAIVLAMIIPTTSAAFWNYLAFISMLLQWIALVIAAVLCAVRRVLSHFSVVAEMLVSFCVMMLASLLFGAITLQFNDWARLGDPDIILGESFLLRLLVISAVIYAIALRFFYIQHQWKQNLRAQSRAEIQALQARIRPHFLFNSMNTIASLIAFKPDSAEKAVEDLSDLFRASLNEKNFHTLEEELALTLSYLDIEKLRLGDRLRIEWVIEQGVNIAQIPTLSLQPLVENAIYHGIEPAHDGGVVSIRARRRDNRLILSVSNPLPDLSRRHHSGNQMAQQNISQRLQLAYGKKAGFYINETKQLYTVTMEIPLVSNNEGIDCR
jgi:two-component system, LytTR family, sensor histidine kinase AlgZ